jgi:hypothetical protein
MGCPVTVFVACHDLHDNPVAYQNMHNADHLSSREKADGRRYSWRQYVAVDNREGLIEALKNLTAAEEKP